LEYWQVLPFRDLQTNNDASKKTVSYTAISILVEARKAAGNRFENSLIC
jgi:hypothetical protein